MFCWIVQVLSSGSKNSSYPPDTNAASTLFNKKSRLFFIALSKSQSSASKKTKNSPLACFIPVFLAADNPEFF